MSENCPICDSDVTEECGEHDEAIIELERSIERLEELKNDPNIDGNLLWELGSIYVDVRSAKTRLEQ